MHHLFGDSNLRLARTFLSKAHALFCRERPVGLWFLIRSLWRRCLQLQTKLLTWYILILVQFVQSRELGSWIEAWVKALFEWCCANAGEVVTTLPCCHWYHTECIRATWQQTMTKHRHSYFAGVPIRSNSWNVFKHNPFQSCGNSETETALGAPRNGCCMQGCAPCARRWWCLRNWESESSSVEEQVCRQTGHVWSCWPCWPMLKQVNIFFF